MPLPALLAVAALAGAATLSSRAQAGSRARMTMPLPAEAHKARLVDLLRMGRWRDALDLNKAEGNEYFNLAGSYLKNVNITGANFASANLRSVRFNLSNLTGTNLANANLTDADLTGAILAGADLTGANLTEANLTGAVFTDADLTGANLQMARLPEGFLAPGTRIDSVPWKGTPFGWQIVASPRGVRLLPLSEA